MTTVLYGFNTSGNRGMLASWPRDLTDDETRRALRGDEIKGWDLLDRRSVINAIMPFRMVVKRRK